MGELVSNVQQPWALVRAQGDGTPGRRPASRMAWLEYDRRDGSFDAWIVYCNPRGEWRKRYKHPHHIGPADILYRFPQTRPFGVVTMRQVRAARRALPAIPPYEEGL